MWDQANDSPVPDEFDEQLVALEEFLDAYLGAHRWEAERLLDEVVFTALETIDGLEDERNRAIRENVKLELQNERLKKALARHMRKEAKEDE